MNDFSIRCPSAKYLRNEDGRSFVHAELAEGTKIFADDGLFFAMMEDDDISDLEDMMIRNKYEEI